MPTRTFATRRVAVICSTVLLAAGLTACGSSPTTPGASAPASSAAVSSALVLDDGWVKAVEAPMNGGDLSATPSPSPTASGMAEMGAMSAMFGTLRNPTSTDLTITGGSSPVAGMVELHETVKNDAGQMQMQPKQGGFVIPAGGTYVLQPGGDHVMLLALKGSLENGTSTTVTLTTSGGDVSLTVPVRGFPGAQESYAPSPSAS